jgi:hypothetical protein
MSHKHSPPRQNVHRGRKPVTAGVATAHKSPVRSAANAAFNAAACHAGSGARRQSPAQIAALIQSGAKTV